MAQVSDNMLTTGLRGKVGQLLVFRVMRGKTFASHAPRKPDKSKETEAQRQTRSNFREASRWARVVLRDSLKKKYYQERARKWKVPNAYTAAIKEYLSNRTVKVNRDRSGSGLQPSFNVQRHAEITAPRTRWTPMKGNSIYDELRLIQQLNTERWTAGFPINPEPG
jgi:hypothetical protein